MAKFKVTWEVYDGYVGGKRPQLFYIDEADILPYEDPDELEFLLDAMAQEAFEQKVSYSVGNRQEALEWMNEVSRLKAEDE